MKYEIRNDKVIIDGYVNAVERFSKPLHDTRGTFIERIMPTVFKRAIEKTDNILVLLNHDYNCELASTKEGNAKLFEDNIGLRAIVEISDQTVIEKAKKGKLRGWSFGFNCNKAERKVNDVGVDERTVLDIDLIEVSIIDDRKVPAYTGTSIELRDDSEKLIEYRGEEFEQNPLIVSENENTYNPSNLTMSQKREMLLLHIRTIIPDSWIEDFDDEYIYVPIDNERATYKMSYKIDNGVIDIDTNNKVKVIRGGYQEVRESNEPEQLPKEEIEKIDYSKYLERINKIKEEI